MLSRIETLRLLRGRGITSAVRRLGRACLYDRRRILLTRHSLTSIAQHPLKEGGFQFRLATPVDANTMRSFRLLSSATVKAWLSPGHFLMLALYEGRPVAYRCLSTVAPWSVRDILSLGPDQLFTLDLFTHPDFRRRGITRQLKIAQAREVVARGFRESWGIQVPLNRDTIEASDRMPDISERVGTLTRTTLFGRPRFSFAPAAPLSSARIARGLSLLALILRARPCVAIVVNPATAVLHSGPLQAMHETAAASGIALRVVTIQEARPQPPAIEAALAELAAAPVDGVLVLRDPMLCDHRRTIVRLINQHRWPAVYEGFEFARAGGLIACSPPETPTNGLPSGLAALAMRERGPGTVIVNVTTARTLSVAIPPALQGADLLR